MHECAPGAAVAVNERVDGLELGMGDRGVGDDREVVSTQERDKVVDSGRDPPVLRGNVACVVG